VAAKHSKTPPGCYWRGSTLWGRVRIKGKLFRWSLETDDPRLAATRRKSEKERLIAIKLGDASHSFDVTAEKWAKEWLIPNKGAGTAERYLCSIAQLSPFVAGRMLQEIDGRLIADVVRARRDSGATNATIKRDLVALSSVFNFALDLGLVESNPVLPRMKRVEEHHHPIVLPSQTDIDLVLRIASSMVGDLIRTALVTGARESELLSAKRDQVDHPRKQMTLIGKGRRGVKKIRVIDLMPFDGYRIIAALPVSPGDPLLSVRPARHAMG
jgi:integrase/recombinase XerD